MFGLHNGFDTMLDNQAVDLIHPDVETSGGLLETNRIADCAEWKGIGTVMHHADMPWCQDIVKVVAKPIIDKGYVALVFRADAHVR